MKLSEELIWRGFHAETTLKDPSELDAAPRKFYIGADPSAESLTIGNLASLMMCAVFVRHGYEPHLLVGGATGQIGDPKDTGERELKSLDEIARNKAAIGKQMATVLGRAATAEADAAAVELPVHDNYDWFKDMNYLHFLREIGKHFSMTQLLDRQFVQARIGAGGSGISYAEFSYTLIQGYDFLHLYREFGIDLQLCGADQFGNCASGMHLIRKLENARADIWSTPLVIDPVSGRKFGKSEGNAVWLDANLTSVFDYYQFWLGQADAGVENFLKIYTLLDRDQIEETMRAHQAAPEKRLAQRALARGSTEVVHGVAAATQVAELTEQLFGGGSSSDAASRGSAGGASAGAGSAGGGTSMGDGAGDGPARDTLDLDLAAQFFSVVETRLVGDDIVAVLVAAGLAASKNEARQLLAGGAVTMITPDLAASKATLETRLSDSCLLRRGKNRFAVVR